MVEVVEEYVLEEKSHADLLHQIVNPQNQHDVTGSGNVEKDYVEISKLEVNEFEHLRHSNLPKELREEFGRMESTCNFGMFTKLSRAWLTVDSNLFLWNFETNSDLAFYDAIKSTIIKVDLANVKTGLFEATIKYLLVVVTVEEIVLLAVSFITEQVDGVKIQVDEDSNAFLVMQEIHQLPLDGTIVEQVCCTSDGRIFFTGDDSLYELTYYFDIWGNRVYKKINLTRGFLSMINVFGSKAKIRQIVCDESRHILFTLSEASKISVYDLGAQGDTFQHKVSYAMSKLQREIGDRFSIDYNLLSEITCIDVIPSTQSMYINLVATLKSGYRAYFTCLDQVFFEKGNDRFSQNNIRPYDLRLVHFRYSPMPIFNFTNSNLTTYYTKLIDDITVIALGSAESTGSSTVYALSSANFPYATRFQESRNVLPIEKAVWTIEASSIPAYEREFVMSTRDNAEVELVPSTVPRSFTRQHVNPTSIFYVVTNDGIDTFMHLKPVEILRRILDKSGPHSRQINTFLEIHGPLETCVMALILLSDDKTIDSFMKEMALRIFVTHGGHPSLVSHAEEAYVNGDNGILSPKQRLVSETSPQPRSPIFSSTPGRQTLGAGGDSLMHEERPTNLSQHLTASPFGHNTLADLSHISFSSHGQPLIDGLRLKPSNRSRAIFTYFSRIVYQIWHKRICEVKDNMYVSGLKIEDVRETLRHVCGLERIIKGYALFTGAYQGSDRKAIEALKQEKNSVTMLTELMTLTKEYLALWQIILEQRYFNATISNLNAGLREQFQRICFADLVSMPESTGLDLISALVHFYLRDDAKISEINERLNNECPRLFTNDDANIVKATGLIYNAKQVKSLDIRQQLISRAIMILKNHAKRVNLSAIASLLKEMNCFKGIAELVIACAAAVDPRGLALTAYHRKMPESENLETKEAINSRNHVYTFLIDVLSYLHILTGMDEHSLPPPNPSLSGAAAEIERDQIIDFILENNDELCHIFLFRFLIDKKLEELVIRKKNPLFERFISREIENGGEAHYFELLWRYYKGIEDFSKAARLLYELATKRTHSINMDKKMQFLSQALICINSAQKNPQNLELRQKIRDWLDVALIQQKTRNTLQAAPENTFEVHALGEALVLLDGNLLTLGDLLQIANRFDLPEIKSEIFECAGVEKKNHV